MAPSLLPFVITRLQLLYYFPLFVRLEHFDGPLPFVSNGSIIDVSVLL